MKTLESTLYRLRCNDFLRIGSRMPVRVHAHRGSLWLTLDGEPDDIQVDDGGCYDFDGGTRLIIGALGGEAQLTITPLRRAGWWLRLRAAFADGRQARAPQCCCGQRG